MRYIYLDTNVISDFKKFNAEDWSCFNKIQKKYHFPFSHAHLFDLSNSPESYLQEDIELLEKISNGYGIDFDEKGEYRVIKLNASLFEFYKNVIKTKRDDDEHARIKPRPIPIPTYDRYRIDLKSMEKNSDSLLYHIANLNNGVLDHNFYRLMSDFIYQSIDDPQKYKLFRKQVNEALAHAKKYNTRGKIQGKGMEILELMSGKEDCDVSIEKIKSILTWTHEQNNIVFNEKPIHEQILDVYIFMDLIPIYRETINNKNRWSNMYYDAQHCANASRAKYYITKDNSGGDRAAFIKRSYDLKYTTLDIRELLNRFN